MVKKLSTDEKIYIQQNPLFIIVLEIMGEERNNYKVRIGTYIRNQIKKIM